VAFYPVREAWQTYSPVGLAADAKAPQVPAEDIVKLAFNAELSHRDYPDIAQLLRAGLSLVQGLGAARSLYGPAFAPADQQPIDK
jgi:hypothetical protein